MSSAEGNALEWALALLHAPGKRHALRQKPLPAGMDGLLGIAAGAMPDALAEAARTFNEPEARIREAAQFYVREVLFFPQADAYRVLGVAADASNTSIKAHHRLLQHWLHPDRLHNEDDAIFASRVNVAWNRLRNPERREAYDRTLSEDQLPEVFDGNDAVASVRTWVADVEIPRNPWRHRVPMLVLSASCVLLVVLVLRDAQGRQDRWESVSSEASGTATEGMTEISVPRQADPAAPVGLTRKVSGPAPVEDMIADSTAVAAAKPAVPGIEPMLMARQAAREETAVLQSQRPHAPAIVRAKQGSVAAYAPASAAPKPALGRDAADSPGEYAPPVRAVQASSDSKALPSYARIQQAWAAGDQLLRFMAGVGRPPPPIWSSPGIQSSADRLREDMHGAGRVRLSGPQWQIGNQSAVLTSGYVVQGEQSGAGRLTADLVWRENRWLVIGLSIERAP